MFKIYGLLGLIIIILAEATIFLKIEPFIYWVTPSVWFGYILLADSIVHMLKGNSLLVNRKLRFLQFLLLSVSFWCIFEIYNKFIPGWAYINLPRSRLEAYTMGALSFAAIIPAIFETTELVQQLHIFSKINMKMKMHLNKVLASLLVVVGIVFLITPLVFYNAWAWAFVWTGFIFLLDPILYFFHDEKSLLMLIKKRQLNVIISLFAAGYICGFLWEFWNYWATSKWIYIFPIMQNIKIFEMPLVGFLGFGPFALELYVMWNFVKLLFSRRFFHGVAEI